MMKTFKSIAISVLALLLIIAVFPISAFAENEGFEPRLEAPSKSNSYYNKTLNVFSQTGYGMPNCTAYAYGRIYEITGEAPKITRGNAGAWYGINKSNGYYSYGQEPQLGAIAVWSGHVAVVEAIDGDTVTCSQSHWRSTYFDTVTFTSGENHFGQKFYGYIYACEDYFASLEEEEEEKNQTYKMEKSQYKTASTTPSEQFAGVSISGYQNGDEQILMNSVLLQKAIG